uniref:hypothetical protein n=1 Tax=Staphylococcus aureus TaxID=1280 RepID=UPI0038B2EAC5
IKAAVYKGYNFLDVVGSLTDGTKIGTVMKVLSLVDKFNTLVQDVKQLEPRAEVFLQHSVKIVADHTQNLLDHTVDLLSKH